MAAQHSSLTISATDRLRRLLDGPVGVAQLNSALRFLAKWRSAVLEDALVRHSGTRVLSGPFAGMDYSVRAAEGSRTARLLGCYEASLSPVIERIIARAYPLLIDIGAAEGYYAVGFARRMPGTSVFAYDNDPAARTLCATLAASNQVAERVKIFAQMDHAGFDVCLRQPTVVVCDIEGGEGALLDPLRAPGLVAADVLVEVHEGSSPGLIASLTNRFSATHEITRIDRQLRPEALPDWSETLSDLDRLLLLWEWRATATPWLWMERKS